MNEKRTIRVALIGCGRIAGHHCESIRAAAHVELAGICDIVAERARSYAEKYDAPWFTNYHDMMRDVGDVDVVAVITPSGMHLEHVMDVMARYGVHMIVEKPTFMRHDQVEAAYQEADRLRMRIFPVFQNRYNKAVRRVRRALDEGELGDIRIVSVRVRWCRPQRYYDLSPWRGTFSHDGGALTNQGIHHVDLIRHLGGEVARVNAVMRTLGADIEVEDAVVSTFEYESGAIGNLEVTTAARPDDFEASISLVGSKGLAQIGGIAVNELQVFTPNPQECAANSEEFLGIEGHGAVYGYGHFAMYQDIHATLADERPFPVSRGDCLGTISLLNAFYRSDEAGEWVDVDRARSSVRLGRANEAVSELYRTPLKEAAAR